MTVKDAIVWSCEAWKNIKTSTIVNCWRKTGILIPNESDSSSLLSQNISEQTNMDSLVSNYSQLNISDKINDIRTYVEADLKDYLDISLFSNSNDRTLFEKD